MVLTSEIDTKNKVFKMSRGHKLKIYFCSSIYIKILSKFLLQIMFLGAVVVEFYSIYGLAHIIWTAQPLIPFQNGIKQHVASTWRPHVLGMVLYYSQMA